ncbi:hypothetical protein DACRYDRAFT_21596 [Dacryopinax primogenitus]|uniref:Uncharacterized protein n=1 Tax=Dacryopinax primogenitus (strain DJM 731) TaxID=1858805 RepID=M5G5A5_DACPD|nr:uncharacterized protein DACRYDRAFT_21596 [Dacryopinax primogenitus]EJU03415.1 hypothetical protein DACRYDRAFT_21596 [Dacryopinax primogenitus]
MFLGEVAARGRLRRVRSGTWTARRRVQLEVRMEAALPAVLTAESRTNAPLAPPRVPPQPLFPF